MMIFATILVASTSLNITAWPDGQGQPGKKSYTLRCALLGGTLPKRAEACEKLSKMTRPFAPVSKNTVCTDLFGGPQEALVTGRLRGYSVRAGFSRKDGCQIARWHRVRFLFPVGLGPTNSR